ncbi:Rap/ran-GAP, partial [Rhizoctonia solani]
MSYTRLKSLFGRLSRRNSSASETSRPSSPAPSLQPHVHSPLQTSTEIPTEPQEPVSDRLVTERRHSSGVAVTSNPATTSNDHGQGPSDQNTNSPPQPPLFPSPPSPVRSPRRRRPTTLAIRASSVGHYDIAVTSESVGRYEDKRDTNSDIHLPRRVPSKADLIMASTEREEERTGSLSWRGRVKDRDKDRDDDEARGTSEPIQAGGGSHTPQRVTRPSFSFLSKLASRARSGRSENVGRRVSEMFTGASPDAEHTHHPRSPTPGGLSTTPASINSVTGPLIPFSTVGSFSNTALTTAHVHGSTTLPTRLIPGPDQHPPEAALPLQLQPLDVLLMALTAPPDDITSPNPSINPTILAAQLAQHFRHPNSFTSHPRAVVGAGPAGISSAAQIGATVLANIARNLRRKHAKGSWEVVGAWVESMSSLESAKSVSCGVSAIERALLWSTLTDPIDELPDEDLLDEWAERDRTVRILTDGGKDVLGLRRFVPALGSWIDFAVRVVQDEYKLGDPRFRSSVERFGSPNGQATRLHGYSRTYVEAQKCIDATLRLLEDIVRLNAPRFDETQVGDVVSIFCGAVNGTIGGWEGDGSVEAVTMPVDGPTQNSEGIGTHRRYPSSAFASPLASPISPNIAGVDTTPLTPYAVAASRFVSLARSLQKQTHIPPDVLKSMLEHLALLLAYVKTPMDVLRLGGRRKSVGTRRGSEGLSAPTSARRGSEGGRRGSIAPGGSADPTTRGDPTARGEVDWVDAYSRAELEGEVSGAFRVLLSGPYAVAVGRILLGLLIPVPNTSDDILVQSALISLGAARAIRLSVREAAIPRMARTRFQKDVAGTWTMTGVPSMDEAEMELMELMFSKEPDSASGAWETDRIVGVLGPAFSSWEPFIISIGGPVEAILVEMLGIVDDLLQEAKENEKAFGIEEGRVIGEVTVAAMQLFTLYSRGQDLRVLDIATTPDASTPLLNPVLQALVGVIRKIGLSTPINPPITSTLLGKSKFLTDQSTVSIIRHYVSMSLVTPSTPDYLNNLRQLFHHFYKPDRPLARIELAQVITKLYFGVRDLVDHRRGVVDLCLEVWEANNLNLVREQELQVVLSALKILGDAIVAGSVESDGRGSIEERLRLLVALIGRDGDCTISPRKREPPPEPLPPDSHSRTRDSSPTPMMSLLNALTPSVLTPRELPSEPSISSPQPIRPSVPPAPALPGSCVDHVSECKAMAAVVTLIQAFSALAFSPPHSLSSAERTARAPASFQCILVMRDLLALLSPVGRDMLDPESEASEERSRIIDGKSCCSYARLAILQWLVRLRADRDHRLYMVKGLDGEIEPFAHLINRTPLRPRVNDAPAAPEPRIRDRDRERDRERRNRGMTTTTPNNPEGARIGRNPSRGRESDSRSRSRQPPAPPPTVPPVKYHIWSIPDILPFDVAFGTRPSEGMTTYEQRIKPSDDGLLPQLWLPVSAYVCVMIDLITTETDWEILSYVLCHLPVQMSNKHLFCGPRTRSAIIRLLSELCTAVYEDKLTSNIGVLPLNLKATDVAGLAYHTLTTLMSYHRTFNKQLQDDLLRTFLRGLNKNTTTVKPCLQALAIAAFELQPSTTKFLGEIVDKLSQIMSNPTIAGYILELLCIIGSIPTLYANFTDDNYRRVFHVPLQYITLHNRPDSHAGPAGKESYALTQHVLILAYYQIYIWFLALKLQDRPKHIPYITRHLLLANEHYTQVDEPTEVCFDWLARFAFANAESKPRMSSLRESVLNPPGSSGEGIVASKSWVFGNSIVTIKTLRHSGWLEIECRRPSGLTTFLCKLENVAALGLGEQVTGEIVEAATEAIGQVQDETSDGQVASKEGHTGEASNIPSGLLNPASVAPLKEMELDPSYLALQLSPYPDIRRASLRGRLVPNDDLLGRTLRSLDRVPVMDFHKIGIIYVGPGQTDEREILGNRAGSPAYTHFLDNIGRLIRLKDQRDLYTGGLDQHYDSDGQYAYAWWDVIIQMLYHTATLMPNRDGDDQFAFKKLHIGNDYVRIIWNDSGKPYRFDTLATQFQYVNIVIEPHSVGTVAAFTSDAHREEFYKVVLQRAPGMPEFGMIGEFKIVSAKCLPDVVRQTSMLADFFAQIYVHTQHDTIREEYITPWRARLRQIRMFKSKLPPIAPEEQVEGILGQEVARDFSRSY